MTNNKPFLTIGIPTWNRAEYLIKNIYSLVSQINLTPLADQVEILICDNASDDETEKVCESLAEKFNFIRYHRHDFNYGANANFQSVIERACGEYIWLLGDDDKILNNSIERVISDIQASLPDVIVGPAVYDMDFKKATHLSYHTNILVDHTLLKKEDVIEIAGKMSGLIFKRDSVMAVLTAAEVIIQETRTPWPHLAWFLLILNDKQKKMLILSYGINVIIAEHWHNLIFDGKTLINIHFIHYQELLLALRTFLLPDLFNKLMHRSVFGRVKILIKCVVYGTYMNSDKEMRKFTIKSVGKLRGFFNKLYAFVFLVIPFFIPCQIRRLFLTVAGFKSKKLSVTIKRLIFSNQLLMQEDELNRRQFTHTQL